MAPNLSDLKLTHPHQENDIISHVAATAEGGHAQGVERDEAFLGLPAAQGLYDPDNEVRPLASTSIVITTRTELIDLCPCRLVPIERLLWSRFRLPCERCTES